MAKGKGAAAPKVSAAEQAELAKLLEEDERPIATPDQLAVILTKADEMRQKQIALNKAESDVERLKKEVELLEFGIIPPLLDAAGLMNFTMDDGWKVERVEEVYTSVSKENMPAACVWFDANDYGDMVKAFYIIEVPKGEKAPQMSKEIRLRLAKAKLPFIYEANVHWQTLKAWGKEALRDAVKLPEIIKVHQKPRAKLIEPKQPKSR